ncbi:MAG: hypothetical protein IT371_20025 [Deltaproteobacteria bacterium]|nr:hypothetical protein [Deltaproteobacteria bacterium]
MIELPIGDTSWKLTSLPDQALVDEQHVQFGSYPNPRAVQWMKVTLQQDGRLCANDGTKSWCGGPLQGIPYLTVLNVQEGYYCVRVVDIFGNNVRSGCTTGTPSTYSGVTPDIAPPTQPVGSGQPGTTPTEPVPGSGGTDGTPPASGGSSAATKDDVAVGIQLVVNAINTSLGKIGLKSRITAPTSKGLLDFQAGDITVGQGTCKDVADYLKSEFSDDHPGTDDWVFGAPAIEECLKEGRCRVGQIVTRAMAEACTKIPAGSQAANVQTGIVGAGGNAVKQLCNSNNAEIEKCVGSPLVLDLAGDGLQLQGLEGGASFPLIGSSSLSVGWLAGSDDALLAIDLDGDGQITSGRELFGEATGGWAPNGFAALARLDANHDGVVSAEDPAFSRLVAWRDNGDGRSAPHELISLTKLGIQKISVSYDRKPELDAHGNQLGLFGGAQRANGTSVSVVDVWFRMRHDAKR